MLYFNRRRNTILTNKKNRGGMIKRMFDKEKGIFEAQITEEHVLLEIMTRLTYAKMQIFRERERIPNGSYRLSDPGHPDLHGWVPRLLAEANFAIPIYIEVKRPGEMKKYNECKLPAKRMKTINDQKLFIESAILGGCIACFAEKWEDVVAAFANKNINLCK